MIYNFWHENARRQDNLVTYKLIKYIVLDEQFKL